jgi:hypothetical protein
MDGMKVNALLILHVPLTNVKFPFLCNICHNKYHLLYIIMDGTTKFTSQMCHENHDFFVWKNAGPLALMGFAHP